MDLQLIRGYWGRIGHKAICHSLKIIKITHLALRATDLNESEFIEIVSAFAGTTLRVLYISILYKSISDHGVNLPMPCC
jgi:hypothetical protein